MKPRILHLAVENYAGLPYSIVKAERQLGIESHLITFYKTFQNFDEEYSLELPFIHGKMSKRIRDNIGTTNKKIDTKRHTDSKAKIWHSGNILNSALFNIRDIIWNSKANNPHVNSLLESSDILILDGGDAITRNGKFLSKWLNKSDKIVEVFYGSDLRSRGIIQNVHQHAQLVFTMEFDHTKLLDDIEMLFFPFKLNSKFARNIIEDGKIRIGHSPTNRKAKGSDIILQAVNELSKKFPIEVILIENMPYNTAILEKAKCDLFIDQIGELGYGVSALEALALGIPTFVELKPDFEVFLNEKTNAHPFININRFNIQEKIADTISNKRSMKEISDYGVDWVNEFHNPIKVTSRMLSRYEELGWL